MHRPSRRVIVRGVLAAGGAAMSTVAYCSVAPGGRVHRHTMVMSPEIVPDLRRLTDAIHDEGAAACAQLGHAGLVANTRSNRASCWKVPIVSNHARVSAGW